MEESAFIPDKLPRTAASGVPPKNGKGKNEDMTIGDSDP